MSLINEMRVRLKRPASKRLKKLSEKKPSRSLQGSVRYRLGDEIWVDLGSNVIINDASIFLARLVKDPTEPSSGGFALAVGTGDSGWDLQDVPAATSSQRSLYTELFRKEFSSIDFIDPSDGTVSAIPTNILDFTCTFSSSEAVGALVEMGIVCGAIDTSNPLSANPVAEEDWSDSTIDMTEYDTFLNVKNFNVINKPSGMALTFVWRVSF